MPRNDAAWMRVVDRITTVLAALSAVIIGLLAVHIVSDAIGRTVFHHPLPATLELSQYGWMPAVTSFGLGYALLKGEHIKVDLLTGGLSPAARRIVQTVAMAVSLFAVTMIAWAAVERGLDSVRAFEHSSGTQWVQIWPGRVLLAIGLIGLTLQVIVQLVRSARGDFADEESEEQLAVQEGESGGDLIDDVAEQVPADHAENREMVR